MSIDFTAIADSGGSFVASPGNWEAYRAWCLQQKCRGCGAKASERPRDETGKVTDLWVDERHCSAACYRKATGK